MDLCAADFLKKIEFYLDQKQLAEFYSEKKSYWSYYSQKSKAEEYTERFKTQLFDKFHEMVNTSFTSYLKPEYLEQHPTNREYQLIYEEALKQAQSKAFISREQLTKLLNSLSQSFKWTGDKHQANKSDIREILTSTHFEDQSLANWCDAVKALIMKLKPAKPSKVLQSCFTSANDKLEKFKLDITIQKLVAILEEQIEFQSQIYHYSSYYTKGAPISSYIKAQCFKLADLKSKGFNAISYRIKSLKKKVQPLSGSQKQFQKFIREEEKANTERVQILVDKFKQEIFREISEFIDSFLGKRLVKFHFSVFMLETEYLDDQGSLQIISSKTDKEIEVQMVQSKELHLVQAVSLIESSFHALFSDFDEKCQYKKLFIQNINRYEDQPFQKLSDPESLIATGSTLNYYILISNRFQKAYFGSISSTRSLEQGRKFQLFKPDKISRVLSASLNQRKRVLYLINEDGRLFQVDMNSKEFLQREIKRPRQFIEPKPKDLLQAPRFEQPVEMSDETDSKEKQKQQDNEEEMKSQQAKSARTLQQEKTGEKQLNLFQSTSGQNFREVKVSPDQSLIFLATANQIEAYKLNYALYRRIEFKRDILHFKVHQSGNLNIFCVQFCDNSLEFYSLECSKTVTKFKHQEIRLRVPIRGNPIIDSLHLMLSKFGLDFTYLTNEDLERKFKIVIPKNLKTKEINLYTQKLELIKRSLNYCGILCLESVQEMISEFKDQLESFTRDEFFWIVNTRVPLHLASIQDHNLIPLKNGQNCYEDFCAYIDESDDNSIQRCVEYIKFGHLEDIFQHLEGHQFKVLSILGRQSSGKSYLLNRLTGARFDVAAHRCTDGIWMSLSKVKDSFFIVLDCEGLFSMKRTIQEEMKMCLLLAAISDVVILNQDLTFNRNLTYLFEKFVEGLDRLKGQDLFKGCLEIVIRDVGENQDEEAIEELKSFIEQLDSQGKADFIMKLFQGNYCCVPYHNFQNPLFDDTVHQRRMQYCESGEGRWKDALEFQMILKTVLAQIYFDDSTDTSERTLSLKIKKAKQILEMLIYDEEKANEIIASKSLQIQIQFTESQSMIQFPVFSTEYSHDLHYALQGKLLQEWDAEFKSKYHNEWYRNID